MDIVSFLFSIIRVMTPLLFASMACMVFTKGGIDSIATDGIMLLSALAGPIGAYFTNNAFLGLLFAILFGMLVASVFGYATLQLKSNPVLAGIAINILAGGLTIFVMYYITGEKGSTQSLASPVLPIINLPLIKDIPVLGKIISGHNILTYIAIISVFVLSFFFSKTTPGLRIRSVGENEKSAQSVGVPVMKYKYMTLIIAGGLAGFGGAFMSMGYVSFFTKNMVAGRGFIGMAAESMGRGNPFGILISTFIFSLADAYAIRMQLRGFSPELMQAVPYLVTIIAISIYSFLADKKKQKQL